MLPLCVKVNLGAMAFKENSAFPKAPAWLDSHHHIVLWYIKDNRCWWWWGVLSFCRDPVGVFYSWLGSSWIDVYCFQNHHYHHLVVTSSYHSLLSAGPQGYVPYPHRAAVCRFELVALLLLGHVKGSIGVHHLWARPYFFSSVLHVWFV